VRAATFLQTVVEDYLAVWSPGARLTTSTRRFSGAFKSDKFFGLALLTRICQKCELGGKPHKFPKPEKALHAILVDMRTFKNGGDVHDRVHIGLGGEYVKEPYRVYWRQGKERKLISGFFGPTTELKGAVEARERVHFIGFVREQSFQPGELGALIQFVANPHLLKDAAAIKTAIDTWPLLPTQILNASHRRYFSRTVATIEPDATWPGMWRIRLPNGHHSDMVNLTRAQDALRSVNRGMTTEGPDAS
jgi:hypothetical protein